MFGVTQSTKVSNFRFSMGSWVLEFKKKCDNTPDLGGGKGLYTANDMEKGWRVTREGNL